MAGWLLLALLAGLLALLAVPVDLVFAAQRREGRQTGSCAVGWLFGAVRVPLCARGRGRTTRKEPTFKAGDLKRAGTGRVMAMLRSEGFVARSLRLGRDLLRRIRVRELSLDARLGLDDPADTGRLWAVVGPLVAMLPLPRAARVAIAPDFAGESFEIDARGDIRIIPLQLMAVTLIFLLSPTTLRALRTAWR